MKEHIRKKVGILSPSHREWYRHLATCIEYEMCPHCGEDIALQEKLLFGTAKKVFFFECTCCRWRNA